MANPNIVNVTSILAATTYLAPANITANTLITNAASSGTVIKVNSLTAANVTATAATVTVAVHSAAAGGGTAYRLAFQIMVPGNATLQIIDKGNFVYLPENTSIVVTNGTSGAINYVSSYETIS
jgi:hypothetical protein